jgi:dihydropteroate synthase
MGVVNATPDSFSDGGQLADVAAAIAHGQQLWRDGADILDVGGEATNWQARGVDAETECQRVLPIIEALAATTDAIISVDTTKAAVARRAIAAGARMVNDVAGGRFDPAMLAVVADSEATYVLGHLRGTSLAEVFGQEGQPPSLADVIAELGEQLAKTTPALRARTWVDPGLGFGKGGSIERNWELLLSSHEIAKQLGAPVLIGASRKRFLRLMLGGSPTVAALDAATVGACLAAVTAGAHAVRVHNVALLHPALTVYTHR